MTPGDRYEVQEIIRKETSSIGCCLFVWAMAFVVFALIVGIRLESARKDMKAIKTKLEVK